MMNSVTGIYSASYALLSAFCQYTVLKAFLHPIRCHASGLLANILKNTQEQVQNMGEQLTSFSEIY